MHADSILLGQETFPAIPAYGYSIEVGEDGLRIRLRIDGLREMYVHELHAPGLRSRDGQPLLHPSGYYTLNRIPAR